jgi:anaphase-promoting complex subunit 1
MEANPITFQLHDYKTSAAHEYLSCFTPKNDTEGSTDSTLLKRIRAALRGADTDSSSTIHSTTFCYTGDPCDEEELTWNAHAAVLSVGGFIKKKWSFHEEKQSIQWACLGWLEQYTMGSATSSYSSSKNSSSPLNANTTNQTFGPFANARQKPRSTDKELTLEPAVFVFLRRIGRIYLKNGLSFTFALPFVVRRAWPLFPHGVLIQRVLESSERTEAEASGDEVLPTIFTITNPFAEAAAVGVTAGIIGGYYGRPKALRDEDELSISPLRSISPTEMIVWTSNVAHDEVAITLDVEKNTLSVWRYTYMKPKDTPVPLNQNTPPSKLKKRLSIAGTHSRRSSNVFMGPTFSPKTRTPDTSPGATFSELPALASLPGMPAALAGTQSLGTMASQQSGHGKLRRNSLTRNDLSVTMDRMALGGRSEPDISLVPMEHGRMKAAYWMECLFTTPIENKM